jgi:hypothetical protein
VNSTVNTYLKPLTIKTIMKVAENNKRRLINAAQRYKIKQQYFHPCKSISLGAKSIQNISIFTNTHETETIIDGSRINFFFSL